MNKKVFTESFTKLLDIKPYHLIGYKMKKPANQYINRLLMSTYMWFVGVAGFEPATSCSQSRRDDRATLHPEGVLYLVAERQGFEPWRQLPVDRLAICSITTLASLLKNAAYLSKRGCKYISKF